MKIRIPASLQVYSGGETIVEANATNVRGLINTLDKTCPGIKAVLMKGDALRPEIAIAIDGRIAMFGLLQPLDGVKEVAIIPAIVGG